MKRFRALAFAAALAVLAVACAGGTDEPIDLPEITAPETTTSSIVWETPAETTAAETSPDTTVGETEPVPAERTAETAEPTDPDGQEECETAGGVWNSDTLNCDQTGTAVGTVESDPVGGDTNDFEPVEDRPADTTTTTGVPEGRKVVYEGVMSEERCLVAGAVWGGGQCVATLLDSTEGVTYWHPTLLEDAYQAVDPETVEADHWDTHAIGVPWGHYNYHVFYHYNDVEDPRVQYEVMREVAAHAVLAVFMYATDWVWFPHRYDTSWTDDANVVAVTGVYPLGEQRTLLVNTDPDKRGRPNVDLPLPLPPPIRPTTPFTEPELWDFAADLGRNCPPVEEIWDGFGAEVTDPCTLQAVQTAVDYMWVGDAVWRQVAIRDGHGMADFLHQIDNIENPYLNAILGYDSRVNGGHTFVTFTGRATSPVPP
ncbi:MAG: hypothetical protein OXR67_08240 [Chloroflexota bacterium]|nr:hypothetical protein [Chloroflexota bacterium]